MIFRERDHVTLEQPSRQNIIACGNLAVIHKLSPSLVRKLPHEKSPYSVAAIQAEARIYKHLGLHRRVACCLSNNDDYVDLRFEQNGDLETYLHKYTASEKLRSKFARQAVKSVVYIHRKGVIHSDLAARQFLLDDRLNLRLSDFCGSSFRGSDAIVIENASHFLPREEDSPNTVQSDIFALGSTLYEIMIGQKPYGGKSDEEIQDLYTQGVFPDLTPISDERWRRVIIRSWTGRYNKTEAILADLPPRLRSTYGKWLFCR